MNAAMTDAPAPPSVRVTRTFRSQSSFCVRVRTRTQKLLWLLNVLVTLTLGGAGASVIAAFIAYKIVSADLPRLGTLSDYQPNIVSTVWDAKGRLMGEFKFD